uniref:Uncharacterized protein n=1 Tax=Arundo donax TaxID=35708 RepID=A0A0A9B1Z0_ARUDO
MARPTHMLDGPHIPANLFTLLSSLYVKGLIQD